MARRQKNEHVYRGAQNMTKQRAIPHKLFTFWQNGVPVKIEHVLLLETSILFVILYLPEQVWK